MKTRFKRLQTDCIDLLYYHAPDGVTPIAETLDALPELVGQGRVRAIGCSNFNAVQLAEADEVARSTGTTRFVALGKTAEPVAAAAGDARCTCTKGRTSMLTHRGPGSLHVHERPDLDADASGPGIFAEAVSISSTRSAGVSDSAYFIKSIELRPTFDLFLGAT